MCVFVCVCVCVCVSEENVDETVDCLEKFADISRSNGLQHNLADAYLCLGNIYYRRVRHTHTHTHTHLALNRTNVITCLY